MGVRQYQGQTSRSSARRRETSGRGKPQQHSEPCPTGSSLSSMAASLTESSTTTHRMGTPIASRRFTATEHGLCPHGQRDPPAGGREFRPGDDARSASASTTITGTSSRSSERVDSRFRSRRSTPGWGRRHPHGSVPTGSLSNSAVRSTSTRVGPYSFPDRPQPA